MVRSSGESSEWKAPLCRRRRVVEWEKPALAPLTQSFCPTTPRAPHHSANQRRQRCGMTGVSHPRPLSIAGVFEYFPGRRERDQCGFEHMIEMMSCFGSLHQQYTFEQRSLSSKVPIWWMPISIQAKRAEWTQVTSLASSTNSSWNCFRPKNRTNMTKGHTR